MERRPTGADKIMNVSNSSGCVSPIRDAPDRPAVLPGMLLASEASRTPCIGHLWALLGFLGAPGCIRMQEAPATYPQGHPRQRVIEHMPAGGTRGTRAAG